MRVLEPPSPLPGEPLSTPLRQLTPTNQHFPFNGFGDIGEKRFAKSVLHLIKNDSVKYYGIIKFLVVWGGGVKRSFSCHLDKLQNAVYCVIHRNIGPNPFRDLALQSPDSHQHIQGVPTFDHINLGPYAKTLLDVIFPQGIP